MLEGAPTMALKIDATSTIRPRVHMRRRLSSQDLKLGDIDLCLRAQKDGMLTEKGMWMIDLDYALTTLSGVSFCVFLFFFVFFAFTTRKANRSSLKGTHTREPPEVRECKHSLTAQRYAKHVHVLVCSSVADPF